MEKSPEAFRTIREVADAMDLPQHVLRFWETRFPQIRPLKRAGGRRYYRPDDIERLRVIKRLLYDEGYTIKGVQKLFKEQGAHALTSGAHGARPAFDAPGFGELAVAGKEDHDAGTEAAAGSGRREASKGQGRAAPPSLGLSAEDLAALRQTLEDIRQAERILTLARSQDL